MVFAICMVAKLLLIMKPLDFKLISTVVLSTMLSLNLSSHSGKTKLVSTSTQPIFSPIENIENEDLNAGVLGNLVWEDMNGDGVQNLGEPGLAKVIVKLFDASHTLQDIKMTNQKGYFRFNNLKEGDYQVEFEKPDGYDFTFCSLNTTGDSDSNVAYSKTNEVRTTELIHINRGEKNLSVDAGMFRCVPIGDMVWFDLNRNNIKDIGESGINGLSVQIFKKDNDQWSQWDEVFTGNSSDASANEGHFRACVPPGEYYLKFDMPSESFANVEPYVGDLMSDSDVTASNGMNTTDAFIVRSGEEKIDLGAGYFSLETVAQARLVKQIEIEDPSSSPLDLMMIEVYDQDNNLVASAKGSEKEKLNMKQFEAEGYYVRFVPASLKRIPAYYAKPASLEEKK